MEFPGLCEFLSVAWVVGTSGTLTFWTPKTPRLGDFNFLEIQTGIWVSKKLKFRSCRVWVSKKLKYRSFGVWVSKKLKYQSCSV